MGASSVTSSVDPHTTARWYFRYLAFHVCKTRGRLCAACGRSVFACATSTACGTDAVFKPGKKLRTSDIVDVDADADTAAADMNVDKGDRASPSIRALAQYVFAHANAPPPIDADAGTDTDTDTDEDPGLTWVVRDAFDYVEWACAKWAPASAVSRLSVRTKQTLLSVLQDLRALPILAVANESGRKRERTEHAR